MVKSSKILLIFSVIAAIITAAFRVFQILVVIDYSEMGFFSSDVGFFASQGMYILFGLSAVFIVLGAVLDKRNGSSAFSCDVGAVTAKQTALLGAAFLMAACFRFYDLVFNFNGFSLDFFGEAAIFIVLIAIGFMLLSHKRLKSAVGYLQLIISISYTVKSAALFMQDTIIVRVSDELILLLSYVASVLFFLALGRFVSSNEGKATRFKLLIFGGASVVLSLCASLSGYIALIVDSEYMRGHMTMHPISQLGTAVVAIAVLTVMYGKNNGSEKNEEIDEDNKSDEGSYAEI